MKLLQGASGPEDVQQSWSLRDRDRGGAVDRLWVDLAEYEHLRETHQVKDDSGTEEGE